MYIILQNFPTIYIKEKILKSLLIFLRKILQSDNKYDWCVAYIDNIIKYF